MQKKMNLILGPILVMCLGFWSCGGDSVDADDLEKANANVSSSNANATDPNSNSTVIKPTEKPSAFPQKAPQPEAPKIDPSKLTEMTFQETSFDFGSIQEGEKVNHTFKFKNTGNKPLLINNAKGSCGCTVPKWPREPIPPGEEGSIKVEFNSANKKGRQNKLVTITANTDPVETKLTIYSEVIRLNEK